MQKSTGAYNFVALTEPTPGQANAAPVVGPIVITEIMYHPASVRRRRVRGVAQYQRYGGDAVRRRKEDPLAIHGRSGGPGHRVVVPERPACNAGAGEYLVLAKDLSLFSGKYTVPRACRCSPGASAD